MNWRRTPTSCSAACRSTRHARRRWPWRTSTRTTWRRCRAATTRSSSIATRPCVRHRSCTKHSPCRRSAKASATSTRPSGRGGANRLTGGAGADRFDFDAITDSGLGAGADFIVDFQKGSDRIDLSTIDASSLLSKNQAFSAAVIQGLTTAFTGAGQLRFGYVADAGMTVVQGNTDGDAAAEFEVHLVGLVPLTATDFVL